ncbi:MAG: phage tail protein [Homoserinimonas sp.]
MSTFAWATVAEVSPLRIRLDGDTTALPFIPDSLVEPSTLALDDRVRCEFSSRRVLIVGRSGGDGGNPVGTYLYGHWLTAPAGYVKSDGALLLIADYPRLAALFASVHGASNYYGGDGITTFATADIGDYVLVGQRDGSAEFGTIGASHGAKTHGHSLSDAGQAKIEGTAGQLRFRRVGSESWQRSRTMSGSIVDSPGTETVGVGLMGATDPGSTIQPSRAALAVIKF